MGVRRNPYAEGESWKTGSSVKQANMEAYLDWLLVPEAEREPPSKAKFARQLGVTQQTLRNYERERWLQSELDRRARGLFKAAKLQDVVETMYEIATDSSAKNAVSAARLLLEWSSRKTADESDGVHLDEMSLEELLELVNRLAEQEGLKVE